MLLFLKDILQPRETEGNIPEVDTRPLDPDYEDPNKEELSNHPVADVDDEKTDTPNFQLSTTSQLSSTSQLAKTDTFSEQSASATPNRQNTATPSNSVQQATSSRKKRNVQSNDENMERELLKIETKKLALLERPEDDDMMFFRSLLPYFPKMQPLQKLRVRNKFQDIIIQELSATSHGSDFSFLHSNSSSSSTYGTAPSGRIAGYISSSGFSSQPISPCDTHCTNSPPKESSAFQFYSGFKVD